jgi:hypothetical protein
MNYLGTTDKGFTVYTIKEHLIIDTNMPKTVKLMPNT